MQKFFTFTNFLSSPLLLRISPNTFAFIPISPMSLSSRNRSNSNTFCHIMPYSAPVCESMHYHKTGVPWQMKSTLIIVLFLLVLPRNALFCKGFQGYGDMLWNYRLWQIRAELSKLLLPVSSKIGSKMEILTTKKLGTFLYQVFYMISSFSSILKLSKYNSWFFFISVNF